ncbi:MAG: ABC transporter substrate-binding protein [Lachnospiraceae bacterium]|nr:ABC transporter substrate-binding protein [Lachnospiraceae bacterium]
MRKAIAVFLSALLSVSVLAGCQGKDAKETESPAARTDSQETVAQVGETEKSANPEGQPESGKHLNVGYYQLKSLDPGANSWEATRVGVGERLFKLNDELKLEPWLVDTYEQVDDLTWKFTLKDGIRFTNGKPLDGAAVKACLERTIEKNDRAVSMLNIDTIEADGQAITVTTKDINAALPTNMADMVCTILDVETLETEGAIPVGTGPFVITSMTEEVYELEANRDYWNGVPKLDTVTIKIINEGNALAMALDNGEVDITFQMPTENVAQFEGRDGFTVTKETGSRGQTVYFNYNSPALAELDVRKAITMAVDRETLANVVNKGNTEAATAIFPVSFAYGDVEGVPYDPEGAKKLLADAGYTDSDGDGILEKDGQPLTIKFLTYGSRGSVLPTMCEAMQSMLKEVGVQIDIELNDYDPHIELLKKGEFDMALNSNIMAPVADPQYFTDILLKTGASYNYGGYSNPEVDGLIEQLDREFDPEQRVELAKQIQEKVVEDCGFLELGHQKYQVAAREAVTGYATQGTELYFLSENTDIN